jgi:hypothetical protein
MRNRTRPLVSSVTLGALLLLLAAVGFLGTFAAKPVLADGPKVVGNITCDPTTGAIAAVFGSSGAPSGLTATDCAQLLADLTKLGFDIRLVTPGSFPVNTPTGSFQQLGVIFTLLPATGAKNVVILFAQSPAFGDHLLFEDGSADVPKFAAGSDVTNDMGILLNEGYSLRFTSPSIPGLGGNSNHIIYVLEKLL